MKKAIWHYDYQWLYIRFEHIGNKEKFIQLIDEFKVSMNSVGIWNNRQRIWKMPIYQLPQICDFTRERGISLVYRDRPPKQLSLGLEISDD